MYMFSDTVNKIQEFIATVNLIMELSCLLQSIIWRTAYRCQDLFHLQVIKRRRRTGMNWEMRWIKRYLLKLLITFVHNSLKCIHCIYIHVHIKFIYQQKHDFCDQLLLCLLFIIQENCNLLVNNEYSEQTRRAMAMLNEKEMSFELIEVCLQIRITVIIYN